MSDESMAITNSKSQIQRYHPTALVIGGAVGLVVGVAGAYLLARKYAENEPVQISAGEVVKLGVLVFGLLRSIATL